MAYENTGRTLSAMFDTRDEADRAASALREIGATDVVLHGEKNPGYGEVRHEDAESRGFFEALGDFFFPDDDRAAYAEGLSRGGYLVTATNVPENLVQPALEILEREGSVDLDQRETEWRDDGWDTATYTGPLGATAVASDTRDADRTGLDTTGEKIDVVEEQINIGKRDVDLGTVRVRSYVREVPVSEEVELTSERVNIERRPVDRAAGDGAFEERVIEAREHSEEAVVQKEARVVEEIALNKNRESHVETVEDTVRKTEVEIEDDNRGLRDRDGLDQEKR
ncbi:YsnF/AvaK domain-containing protein [Paracoccus aerodenitrificans]|uniref:YsnF/AvaK domain-containing protein n=1 Tax=Paracoccus aerodenitrificans TaxID=3017781 RepID=UPI0022F10D0A|nr:YsnF/AvaK domain-containing protein [Paracoccus aerodenitrificans]WBU62644.1 YsnF/AvaK domain-containing protein [Paracoccus aerodenitrificans]